MGVIDRFLSRSGGIAAVTQAAGNMAEIFTPNATRRMELDEEAHARAIAHAQAEFVHAPAGWFDGMVDGMNRLPRPLLTLGTMGLFGYAMVEPHGFSLRMQGLALVPEPLWWLMGAIVSFYFGAREAHYFRNRGWGTGAGALAQGQRAASGQPAGGAAGVSTGESPAPAAQPRAAQSVSDSYADNAALRDWAATRSPRKAAF